MHASCTIESMCPHVLVHHLMNLPSLNMPEHLQLNFIYVAKITSRFVYLCILCAHEPHQPNILDLLNLKQESHSFRLI